MEDLLTQFLGFVIGILSSWVFLYVLLFVKPQVRISPFVCYLPDQDLLHIRVMNWGRRQATDISVQSRVEETFVVPDGFRRRTLFRPAMTFDTLVALNPLRKWNPNDVWSLPVSVNFSVKGGKHVIDLMSKAPGNERRFGFTLSATDSLSGTKVVQRIYYTIDDIKVGVFAETKEFRAIALPDPNNE
ncbi:MAG: hypothetical protein MN733_24350 [Nitrososphaera sp.]|nr:hypothetical protein [Nitrososphaera sp.]